MSDKWVPARLSNFRKSLLKNSLLKNLQRCCLFVFRIRAVGRGVGLVVNILVFYSDDPSSNPAGCFNFQYKETKINKKEAEVGPFSKIVRAALQVIEKL